MPRCFYRIAWKVVFRRQPAGYFELWTGGAAPAVTDLDTTVTHLLLDHARLRDEATR